MANNKVEVRTFRSGSLRSMSQGDEMVIAGRALSYGVLSSDLGGYREQLQRGCFTRSLKSGQDVLCRREHQTGFLLGRTKNGTLQLSDGPDGLDFTCKIDPSDPIAVSTHSAVRSGLIDSMSFAFTVDGNDGESFDSSTDENGRSIVRRTIKRAMLADVAPVAAPAYPQGTSVSARAADYSVLASVPRTVPATAAEMRVRIAAFDARQKSLRVQRHLEVRRLLCEIPRAVTRTHRPVHQAWVFRRFDAFSQDGCYHRQDYSRRSCFRSRADALRSGASWRPRAEAPRRR